MQHHHALIAVMAVVIAVLSFAVVYFARDELHLAAQRQEEAIPSASSAGNEEGEPSVTVSAVSQKASGIVSLPLKPVRSQAVDDVYGAVVNLQPLYELRGRYLAALAESRALRSAVAASRAEHDRARRLYDDDRNVSQRVVQAAEAQWKTDLGRLQASEQSAASLADSMRASWGAAITSWATDPAGQAFARLAAQRSVLVQIAFPRDLQPAAARAAVEITPVSVRGTARPARFVSASPQTDPGAPGATYFYSVEGDDLRSGMRVTAQLKSGAAREGVAVPEAAVVWHAGKAWAYVKEDEDRFVRRLVRTDREIGDAWFNAEGFEAGEEVVVSGAQLLLSEELKFQIRNENED
jgi:hypothetical protein